MIDASLVEAVLKLGLAPTLLLLVFFFYKDHVNKHIKYLEKQNEYLLKKLFEKENEND